MIGKNEVVNYYLSHGYRVMIKASKTKIGDVFLVCNYEEFEKIKKLSDRIFPVTYNVTYEFVYDAHNIQDMIYKHTGYYISSELLNNNL
jgi:methyl coenzyme M reductase subunit D